MVGSVVKGGCLVGSRRAVSHALQGKLGCIAGRILVSHISAINGHLECVERGSVDTGNGETITAQPDPNSFVNVSHLVASVWGRRG